MLNSQTSATAKELGRTPFKGGEPDLLRGQWIKFTAFALVLALCFIRPLHQLADYALHNDFFSYIPLIPCIAAYLLWQKRLKFGGAAKPAWSVPFFFAGFALLAWARSAYSATGGARDPYLTLITCSFLLFLLAGTALFFGWKMVWAARFPLAFLIFMVPIPEVILDRIVTFFQYASAETASGLFTLFGTPLSRDGLIINLPHFFSLRVAPECSGIHSTMVLLITAVLAAEIFLVSHWKRAALILFIIPLAIFRNGFRIFVIGELCVHISPTMIDSPIHHHGGPLFFVLSLIPFFLLLVWLRKSEPPARAPARDSSPDDSEASL